MVRLPFLFIVLFSAIMLFAQSPAYADPELRALLLPPVDCSAPCFIGIRPGLITVDGAVQVLQVNPLIQSIRMNSFGRYNEQSIEAFVALRLERIQLLLDAQNSTIEAITLSNIHTSLGDLVLVLGQPLQFVFNTTLNRGSITYAAFYPQYEMTVAVHLPLCSLEPSTFWSVQQFVSITIEAAQAYAVHNDYYLTGAHQSRDGWAKQIRDLQRANCA